MRRQNKLPLHINDLNSASPICRIVCILFLLLSISAQSTFSSENLLQVSIDDHYIRQQQPLRILIETMHSTPAVAFPLNLKISLFFGSQTFHEENISIQNWATLSQGILIHPLIPNKIRHNELRCLITLHNRIGSEISRSEIKKNTLHALRQRFNDAVKKVHLGSDPVAHLRLEQCALLLQRALSISASRDVDRYLNDIENPDTQTTSQSAAPVIDGAYQARSDASWQPYRLHHNKNTNALAVICHETPPGLNKAQWPSLDKRIIQQALAQGLSCLEIYPAGDHQWTGISRERIAQSIAAARQSKPALRDKPLCMVGVGLGCNGALRAAMADPQAYTTILFSDCPDWKQSPHLRSTWERWQQKNAFKALGDHQIGFCNPAPNLLTALSATRAASQRGLLTRLDLGALHSATPWQWLKSSSASAINSQRTPFKDPHFTEQPFLCIVGSGEHLEAKQHIQDLMRSLEGAWVQHSQGRLPTLQSQGTHWDAHPNHNLIFIGNPLDNNCLREFIKSHRQQLTPILSWDQRNLSSPDGASLRSNVTELQWLMTLNGRHYWVLDGSRLRFPIGILPLQNAHSQILLRSGKTLWHSE